MIMAPIRIETNAFNRGSPGRLIHREKFGLNSDATPIPVMRRPTMSSMTEFIMIKIGLLQGDRSTIGKDLCSTTHDR